MMVDAYKKSKSKISYMNHVTVIIIVNCLEDKLKHISMYITT